jgi:hypothetical protein
MRVHSVSCCYIYSIGDRSKIRAAFQRDRTTEAMNLPVFEPNQPKQRNVLYSLFRRNRFVDSRAA